MTLHPQGPTCHGASATQGTVGHLGRGAETPHHRGWEISQQCLCGPNGAVKYSQLFPAVASCSKLLHHACAQPDHKNATRGRPNGRPGKRPGRIDARAYDEAQLRTCSGKEAGLGCLYLAVQTPKD